MLKVLFVTSEYPPYVDDRSGLGSHSQTLATALAQLGCEVAVITYNTGDGLETTSSGVRLFVIGDTLPTVSPGDYRERMLDINEHVAEDGIERLQKIGFRPDVVHSQGSYGIVTAEILARHFRCPLIGTAHLLHQCLFDVIAAPAPRPLVEFDRRLCASVDALIVVSEFLAGQIAKLALRPDKRIYIIHNGTSLPPEPAIQSVVRDVACRSKRITFVGRLVRQKGLLPLLQSAKIVLDEFPNISYRLIGARYDEPFCRMLDEVLAEYPRLRRAVQFDGPRSRSEVIQCYRDSYMAVLPSFYESFGLAAVEAMLAGTPVVATAVGGLKEVIIHGKSGLLVTPDGNGTALTINPFELASAQIRLLRDPQLATQLGLSGLERATALFSDKGMATKTLGCYEEEISLRC